MLARFRGKEKSNPELLGSLAIPFIQHQKVDGEGSHVDHQGQDYETQDACHEVFPHSRLQTEHAGC